MELWNWVDTNVVANSTICYHFGYPFAFLGRATSACCFLISEFFDTALSLKRVSIFSLISISQFTNMEGGEDAADVENSFS